MGEPVQYPADHQLGMRVPIGGSDCAKCEYLAADSKSCMNKIFVKWNGGSRLPEQADRYCCDLFEPEKARPNESFFGEKR